MISFSRAETNTVGILSVSGELTLQQEANLKSAILEALLSVDNLFLDFGKVTVIDTSCLDIISICYKMGNRLGKHVTISGQSPEFLSTIKAVGYSFADSTHRKSKGGSQP